MTKFFTKTLTNTAFAALALAAVAASATPASAKWGRNAALFGGLAAGAVIAGVAANAYAAPAYAPGYAPAYEPACWREKRAVTNRYGEVVGFRSIRVCE